MSCASDGVRPWHTFRRLVAKYRGDFNIRRFSCLDQFRCAFYVMDRGYLDFERLYALQQAGRKTSPTPEGPET